MLSDCPKHIHFVPSFQGIPPTLTCAQCGRRLGGYTVTARAMTSANPSRICPECLMALEEAAEERHDVSATFIWDDPLKLL